MQHKKNNPIQPNLSVVHKQAKSADSTVERPDMKLIWCEPDAPFSFKQLIEKVKLFWNTKE